MDTDEEGGQVDNTLRVFFFVVWILY